MQNPITLFTGQWADMTLEQIAAFAQRAGYDGLEMATWGKHYNVQKALHPKTGTAYVDNFLRTLDSHNLGVWSFGGHLVGQAIAAKFANDPDLLGILPDHIRSSDAERVRLNAAKEMGDTARAVEKFRDRATKLFGAAKAEKMYSPHVVTGFTGSPIWHKAYSFPPVSATEIAAGFEEVAYRMARVLDVFRDTGNVFAKEIHPTEAAFDTVTTERVVDTVNRDEFGVNGDCSHFGYQGVNYLGYNKRMQERGKFFHTHIKDVFWQDVPTVGEGASETQIEAVENDPRGVSGVHGGHLPFGDAMRYWDFRSVGRGRLPNGIIIARLIKRGYTGPFSVEWEDALLKRKAGAIASQLIVRGYRDEKQSLVNRGLAIYKDKRNYQNPSAFDKAFAQ